MKAKLLKKLRKKYSSKYKIAKTSYGSWEVYMESYEPFYGYIDRYQKAFNNKEEAIAHVRKLVNSRIESYLLEHREVNVTSKMLYG